MTLSDRFRRFPQDFDMPTDLDREDVDSRAIDGYWDEDVEFEYGLQESAFDADWFTGGEA